jgi:hypothetical protein
MLRALANRYSARCPRHVVEPPALWEKYLDPEYRMLGKHALWRQEGRTGAYLKVNGEIWHRLCRAFQIQLYATAPEH